MNLEACYTNAITSSERDLSLSEKSTMISDIQGLAVYMSSYPLKFTADPLKPALALGSADRYTSYNNPVNWSESNMRTMSF